MANRPTFGPRWLFLVGLACAANAAPDELCSDSFQDDTAVDRKASWRSPGFAQTQDHPAVCVSWQDAHDYAAWLARKTGLGRGLALHQLQRWKRVHIAGAPLSAERIRVV
jgi:formylglycine-generating enzyme required for sulfatase activity